ncbi:MerR family transcriptional regulator [Streptomyces sp. NPDC127068]|uniref:MerR family transcriptional regulator n=1 Tax=Streptomyces sp. NPDC127068 TaxID=3347127 RepID=UPI0036559147
MKSSAGRTTMTVGQLAGRFGLGTHVLRHWESVGLLRPERDGAGRRRYDEEDAVRVAAVLRAKAAGLSLGAIRRTLDCGSPAERRDRLERHRDLLRDRIARLQASLTLTEHALDCPVALSPGRVPG